MNKGIRQTILTVGIGTLLTTPVFALPKAVEDKINKGIQNYESTIKLSIEGHTINDVVDYVKSQPFYSIDSMKFGGAGSEVILYPQYYETKDNMVKLSRIVSLVASEAEPYTPKEKVYYVVQRIAELMRYDTNTVSSTINFSPTTILEEGRGVCQAYARLADLIFKECGLESSFVEGTLNGIPHLWNAVKINGEWFSVDVTAADRDEDNKIDFKYVFMRKSDLETHGYKVIKTDITLSDREVRDFKDVGLVSVTSKNFYNQVLKEVSTILAYSYRDKKLSVISSGEDFWVVGGELFIKEGSNLRNMTNNQIYYTALSGTDVITNKDAELRVNDKVIYNSSNLTGDKVKVIDGDFKVTVKDSKLANLFTILEGANKTNVFYRNKFLIQYIRR